MTLKWNADKYTKDFSFVHQYGNDVLELLDIHQGMTVLDLGCGNGTLTNQLFEKGVSAIGLDASNEMLHIAKTHYPHLEFIQANATDFKLNAKVDAVFSNAVFHWVHKDKQIDMLNCIYDALKNQGQLVFELGGLGNNTLIHTTLAEIFKQHGLHYKMPFFFPSIGEYSTMLEQAGFKVVYMILFDRMTKLNGNHGLEDWIRMFIKTPFENLSTDEIDAIIKEAVHCLKDKLFHDGIWYSDYVRLRGKAIKA